MPSSYTPNYNLNQWARADKVLMDDFNADNAKIDAALKAEAGARASADGAINDILSTHTTELARRGNCQIYTTSYVGTGKYGESNPNTLTFPHRPLLIFINGVTYGTAIVLAQGCNHVMHLEGNRGTCYPTWQDNSVSWFSADSTMIQMNELNKVYSVTVLSAVD